MSKIPSVEPTRINLSDRLFHVEILRGGMNRLLLRSNKSETWSDRIEIFFMYVQYMAIPMTLHGPVIEMLGRVDECRDVIPGSFAINPDLKVYSVRSQGSNGLVVASALALDESTASASDPSNFPMMS